MFLGIITSVKTQIIQLEDHDDTLSVRDKMDWSQAPRILLVWPEGGKVLRNRLDLILLERFCSSHGSQLALLSQDPEVAYQAGKAGIPVFQTRREAQLQPWGKSFREFQRQDLQRYKAEIPPADLVRAERPPRTRLPVWARIPIFTAGVAAVLALAGILLPSARIELVPTIQARELTLSIQARTGEAGIGISGTVPGRTLDLVMTDQLSLPASSRASIPSSYARGEVLFSNLGSSAVTIPSGTILSTGGEDPVLFRTLADVETPEGSGEFVAADIEALYPGAHGNVPGNAIQQINLSAGAELSVTNPAPTTGGEDLLIPAPGRNDRLQLSLEMQDHLAERARQEAALTLGAGDVLLTTAWDEYQVLDETYSPEDNSPGDTLWLERSAEFRAYYAAGEDLLALASELVQAQYQEGSYQPDLGSISITSLTTPEDSGDGLYRWEALIAWKESQWIDAQDVIRWIAGSPPEDASQALQEGLDLAAPPLIDLWPQWWPRIPVLPFRIQVIPGGAADG